MNAITIGQTNAEIVDFLPPPQSPERLPHPRTCLGL
ncbi:similar to mKIAA0227 protein (predicted), isoform CRA_a [Rattus norvegicus]|uniref:Similar to mKIAA0227 protein (Predicted), isoform CRA_a n=1 Tax=Rattus norvegicus TaxID=10116 RepID=A6JDN7_RAT|nr:similar to mKIAA0227 protein (predicted), isoform CRA_a [Rattus norvegicus]